MLFINYISIYSSALMTSSVSSSDFLKILCDNGANNLVKKKSEDYICEVALEKTPLIELKQLLIKTTQYIL